MRPLLNEIRKIPFIRLVISLIAGILMTEHFNLTNTSLMVLSCLLIVLLITFNGNQNTKFMFRTNWIHGLLLNMLIALIGYIMVENREVRKQQLIENTSVQEQLLIGKIVGQPEEKNKSYKVLLKVNKPDNKDNSNLNETKVLCYLEKDIKAAELMPGDIILFNSRLNPIKNSGNPGEFDFEKYMSIQKIYLDTYIKSDKWIISQKKFRDFITYVLLAQNKLTRLLDNLNLRPENLAVLKALLLGEKTGLDAETMNAYINSGTVHILSVSGLHVGIIYLLLGFLFSFLNKNKLQILLKVSLILVILWMYAFITGFVPSIQRATLMFTFILIGRSFNKEINSFNVLALSAFVLIFINPLVIYDVGFQLSYSAVLSIMIFYNPIYSRLLCASKVLNYITSLICLSIAAQVLTFPIILYYFNQFPTCFPIANLIVVPMVPVIMFGGIILLIMSGAHIAIPLYIKALDFVISFMTKAALIISELPFALIKGIGIHSFQLFFLYGCIVFVALFLYYRIPKYVSGFLIFIIIMLTGNAFIDHKINSMKEVLIYNIKGHSILKFSDNNSNILLCDNEFYINSEWQNSKFLNHGMTHENITYISIDSLFNKAFISNQCIFSDSRLILSHSKKIAILKDRIYKSKYQIPENKLKVDYLLMSAGFRGSIALIKEYLSFDTLIIDPSVSYYIQKQIFDECIRERIKCISIAESGAQKYSLN